MKQYDGYVMIPVQVFVEAESEADAYNQCMDFIFNNPDIANIMDVSKYTPTMNEIVLVSADGEDDEQGDNVFYNGPSLA